MSSVVGRNVILPPLKRCSSHYPWEPVNVTIFENKEFTNVIALRGGHRSWAGANSVNIILIRSGIQTETHKDNIKWRQRQGMEWCTAKQSPEAGGEARFFPGDREGTDPGAPWSKTAVLLNSERINICLSFQTTCLKFLQPREINEGSEGLRALLVTMKSGVWSGFKKWLHPVSVLYMIPASWSSSFLLPRILFNPKCETAKETQI